MSRNFFSKVFIFYVILSAIVLVTSVQANEESPVGKDRFKLTIGGFFPALDSQVEVDSRELGTGTKVDLEDDLGFDDEVELAVIEGYWRFAKKHRLFFGYYGFEREAKKTLEEDIEWDDKVFELGVDLKSKWDLDFIVGGYGYSFFQGDKWELSGTLGLYFLSTSVTLRGEAQINNVPGGVSAEVTEEESIGLPIPLFGLTAEYYLTPKWRTMASVGYFTVSIDEWDGSVLYLKANLEYLFHKNFGIGTGYLYFDADIERDRTKRKTQLDYEYQGIQIYGIWHF